MDLVISARAFVGDRLVEAEIGIAEGKIARVAKSLAPSETSGAARVSVPRGIVLPGAVDGHVHLREPGLEHKESIATGTLAALHGGVTTVLEMPNTVPAVSSLQALRAKRARFEASALVDWGLHAMVDPDLRCFDLGAEPVAYKAYLGGSTHAAGLSPRNLAPAVRRAHAVGRPLVVHAEHPDQLGREGADSWEGHGAARPAEAEREGIAALARATGESPGRVLVAHVTTARALALARKAGLRTEVCPHHLLLDDTALRDQGPFAKVNPPLRGPKERAALWKAFAAGKADHLGSDHAPHLREEKAQGFAQAPSGMPGVETLLPLMLAKVKTRALSLRTLMRATGEGPAEFFRLPKGRIAAGYDADLIAVDLTRTEPVLAANLHSACGWTCFEGQSAVFPTRVWLRGQLALAEGAPQGIRGREVRPAASPGKPS